MPQAVVLRARGGKTPLYPARYAHGLFFALLSRVSPELAQKLHEAPRKPFTLAPLPRAGPEGATLKGTLRLRLTTLDDGLFAPFLRALLEAAPDGLPLGDSSYRLARVLATREGHPWPGPPPGRNSRRPPSGKRPPFASLPPRSSPLLSRVGAPATLPCPTPASSQAPSWTSGRLTAPFLTTQRKRPPCGSF